MNEEENHIWSLICVICAILITLLLFAYTPRNAPSATSSLCSLLHFLSTHYIGKHGCLLRHLYDAWG